ncbi:tetratricopeptide repeat protein, partial [Virgisporangium aurantiacum]|uniref:tetratricopeptide repeat protein n=1 Tax=Virgisporangium aurantiacum TaxID=175570 RepID=UPI00194DC961
LGTDPSPELQDVYRSILAGAARVPPHQPAAATHAAAAAGPAPPPVPAQLPLDVPGFTGRAAQLTALDDLVDAAAGAVVVTALSGTAGVGKTALSVHWAHRARHRFPDGQLYVNLRGFGPSGFEVDPADALEGFLAALGVPAERIPRDPAARAAEFRSLLADRRVLVLVDNARDADQARPLLPGTPGSLAIVTSRNQLTSLVAIEGARPVHVGLLSPDEAWAMLARRLGADRVAAEAGAVERISTACARLPIALAIVAALAAGRPDLPLDGLADQLAGGAGLDVLDGGDPSSNVRTVFSWSLRAVDPAAARLLRLLGLHPGPATTVAAAASLAGLGTREAAGLLADLARANLVTEQSPGRFALHDLLHAYAADLVGQVHDDEERRVAKHRLLDHYLHSAAHAARMLHPHMAPIALVPPQPGTVVVPPADGAAALAWFAAEDPVLLELIRDAGRVVFDAHVWQLARSRELFAIRQGKWTGMIAAQHLALDAARRAGDREAAAQVHCGLARAHIWIGDLDEANRNLTLALAIFGDLGDLLGQARTQHALTELFDRRDDHRTAIGHAYRALALYEEAGDVPGTARALNAVGWCHTRLDEHGKAVERCERALGILRDIGDVDGEAATRGSLGHAYQRLGRFTEAIGHYRRAIELCRDLGERFYEADTLTHLGDTHRAAGDDAAAVAAWRQALDVFTDLEHPRVSEIRDRLAIIC